MNQRKTLIRDSVKRYLGKPQVPRKTEESTFFGGNWIAEICSSSVSFLLGRLIKSGEMGQVTNGSPASFVVKRQQRGTASQVVFSTVHHILLLNSFIQVQTEASKIAIVKDESRKKNAVNIEINDLV